MRTINKTALTVLAGGFAIATVAGCSSNSSSTASTSPTASPTGSSSGSSGGLCTEATIMASLPSGAKAISTKCVEQDGTFYAAAKVEPGPTVFFLVSKNDKWDVETSDQVCGTASAGLPPEILAYCDTPSPSASSKKPKS